MLRRFFSGLEYVLGLINPRNWVVRYLPKEDDRDTYPIFTNPQVCSGASCTSVFTHYAAPDGESVGLFHLGSESKPESEAESKTRSELKPEHVTQDRGAGLSVMEMPDSWNSSDSSVSLIRVPLRKVSSSVEDDPDISFVLTNLQVRSGGSFTSIHTHYTASDLESMDLFQLDSEPEFESDSELEPRQEHFTQDWDTGLSVAGIPYSEIRDNNDVLADSAYDPYDDVSSDYGYNPEFDCNESLEFEEALPPIVERAEVAPFCERNYWTALDTKCEVTSKLDDILAEDAYFLLEVMISDKHDALLGRPVSLKDELCLCQACVPLSPNSTSPDPSFDPHSFTLGPGGKGPGAVLAAQDCPRKASTSHNNLSGEDSSLDPCYQASGRNLRPLPSKTDWLEREVAEASFWVWRWPRSEEEESESDLDSSYWSLTESCSPGSSRATTFSGGSSRSTARSSILAADVSLLSS